MAGPESKQIGLVFSPSDPIYLRLVAVASETGMRKTTIARRVLADYLVRWRDELVDYRGRLGLPPDGA